MIHLNILYLYGSEVAITQNLLIKDLTKTTCPQLRAKAAQFDPTKPSKTKHRRIAAVPHSVRINLGIV